MQSRPGLRRLGPWMAVLALAVIGGGALFFLLRPTGDTVATDTRTWLLPAEILAQPAEDYFVTEVEAALWPPDQTLSLWRTEDGGWVLAHLYPLPADNVLGTPAPLRTLFGEADLPDASPEPLPAVLPEGTNAEEALSESWLYASPAVDGRVLAAIEAGLREDPRRQTMGAPIPIYVDDAGEYDPALRAAVEATGLERRVVLAGGPGVRAVVAFGETGGAVALAEPIPLDVLPIEVTGVVGGDEYDVHETAEQALIVRDGEIHAVVRGPSVGSHADLAATVVEIDDLDWGLWAWPRLGAGLRLGVFGPESDSAEAACSGIVTLDGGCLEDVTPAGGLEWTGRSPSPPQREAAVWRVGLPLERLPDGAPASSRLAIVRQGQVVFQFQAEDVPGLIDVLVPTQRDALRIIKMLYPAEPILLQ